MKIAFFVNDIATEKPVYTTTRLAMEASNQGHEVWLIGACDFTYEANETVSASGRSAPRRKYRSPETYLAALKGEQGVTTHISVDDLDVLLLRNDPSMESGSRAWARSAGIIFGSVAMRSGVIVLNDPNGLAGALDKMFIQFLPESVRPRTLITRDRDEIKAFVQELGGKAVLKALRGIGTRSVFAVTPDNRSNLNQMIEAISRDGYIIAQEFVAGAETGSTRLFVMNGELLRHKGKTAAFRWVRTGDDMRANIHISGTTEPVTPTDTHQRIAEAMRPWLVQEGMFLAGLQIADDKLIDIDVFSPGGLGVAQSFTKVNFAEAVIDSLVNKVQYMGYYRRQFDNVDLATL
jgi:glutathione synthase